MALFEKIVQFGLCRAVILGVVRSVFECEMATVVGSFAIGDVLGNVFFALVVRRRIPILTIAAAVHVLRAVWALIGTLHLDALEVDFIATFKTKMMSFFDFG